MLIKIINEQKARTIEEILAECVYLIWDRKLYQKTKCLCGLWSNNNIKMSKCVATENKFWLPVRLDKNYVIISHIFEFIVCRAMFGIVFLCVCVFFQSGKRAVLIYGHNHFCLFQKTQKKFRITLQHPANGFYYYNIFFNVSNMQIIFFSQRNTRKKCKYTIHRFFLWPFTHIWLAHFFFLLLHKRLIHTRVLPDKIKS